MQRRVVWLVMMVLGATVAASANANDWGNLAVISDTMGNHAGRICIGEGLRVSDIGCPSYAPSITTAGDVSVTGNLSANKFIGDGSGLTGVGQSDRITSGTTNIIATQDRSLTFTAANGQRMIVGENGFVGIGTDSPITRLQVEGSDFLRSAITQKRDAFQWNHIISANGTYLLRYGDVGVSNELFYLMNTGRLGIGTTNPLATTHVSGSFMASTNGQTSAPSLYADAGKLSVGTTTPSGTIELRGLGNLNVDFTDSDSTGAALVVRDTQPNQQSGGQILFGSSYGLFAGIKSELRSGSGPAGNLDFQTRNTSGDILRRMTIFYNGSVGIGISNTTAGVATTLLVSGSFAVSTSAQATTPSFYVGTNGRVGIGANAPLAKLDVNGTISASDAIQVGASSLTCGAGIPGAMRYSSGNMQFCNGTTWTTLGSAGAATAASSTGAIQFNSANALAGDTANLFWDDTNNRLGIGTQAPSTTLTVTGNAVVSGTVQVAGAANETCTSGKLGTIRFNPETGAPQICVQR